MQKILFFFACFFALSVSAKNTISYLSLERTPCFGRCATYTVEFFSNGEVVYTGKANVKMLGVYKARISKTKMRSFFSQFEKYKYAGLQSRYNTEVVDAPGMHIGVRVNGKLRKVKHAEAGPRFLTQIGADIDEQVELLKWKAVKVDEEIVETVEIAAPVAGEPEPEVFIYAEQMPQFPGGEMALKKYLRDNIQYPQMAKENGIEGKVFCKFIVDKTGVVTKAEVVRGIGHGCDSEALRVIKGMPAWIPGKQNGKNVSVTYTLPVFFKLQ